MSEKEFNKSDSKSDELTAKLMEDAKKKLRAESAAKSSDAETSKGSSKKSTGAKKVAVKSKSHVVREDGKPSKPMKPISRKDFRDMAEDILFIDDTRHDPNYYYYLANQSKGNVMKLERLGYEVVMRATDGRPEVHDVGQGMSAVLMRIERSRKEEFSRFREEERLAHESNSDAITKTDEVLYRPPSE